ncbi:MAG: FAD/NAD(P)-binding protein [Acidimicrobiia bacterium]|nr:FAD/NAD(P)-binding protein [Acidimicrobiia bacterium]MBT8215480.1 FAD/NAD(P)-binding protein [Acidimicrobiia bacterium]NNF10018.1 FAD/NAD(P)-binding protein [Acidimicrobiia bacterium]NNL71692.1 FAD/NAD(P)-binding protein [Acidimicrobiia bacterium]
MTTAQLRSEPMLTTPTRVLARTQETADTFTIEVEPPPGFSFRPGEFTMLYVYGVGEVPISISGDPDRTDTLTLTIRAVGKVTEAVGRLQPGDPLGVRGPYGVGWPMEAARGRDVVIVGGGIGLAPLRSAIYEILNHRADYGLVSIAVGFRRPEEILYVDQVHEWRQRFDIDLELTVDTAGDTWRGPVGVVTRLIPMLDFSDTAVAMVCGPEIMMMFTARALRDRGFAPDNIHVSLERNMKCGIGLCGHCQYGQHFVCMAGPVKPFSQAERLFGIREL